MKEEKETKEMLEIIHNNHDRVITEEKIERMIKEDRKRLNKKKELKQSILLGILITICLIAVAFVEGL